MKIGDVYEYCVTDEAQINEMYLLVVGMPDLRREITDCAKVRIAYVPRPPQKQFVVKDGDILIETIHARYKLVEDVKRARLITLLML